MPATVLSGLSHKAIIKEPAMIAAVMKHTATIVQIFLFWKLGAVATLVFFCLLIVI